MKKILAGIAILAVAAAAQADLLASWNFTGSNSSAWDAASPIDANRLGDNVASATLSTANFTASSAGNALRQTGSNWGTIGETADTLAANRASYIGVTLTANSGYTLTVSDIIMSVAGSGTGQGGYSAWANGDGTQLLSTPWQATANATDHPVALTTQPSGSTVDLRLVASLTTGTGTWGFAGVATSSENGSLRINGTTTPSTAVPEPATMSLLGLGALAMVIRRKLSK